MADISKNSSSQSELEYYASAEKKAAEVPGISEDTPRIEINKAAVIGAGTMGVGIVVCLINAGAPVALIEREQEVLSAGMETIRGVYERDVSKGRLTRDEARKRMSLLTPALSLKEAADADIIIEAVFENMEIKKKIFAELDAFCKKDAILASNTSYLDINEIAAATKRPESVLGLHFFSPANIMRLLEVVRGAETSDSVLASSLSLAKKLKKIAVVVGVCYGFAGNRMYAQRKREAVNLILEGASPLQVDQATRDFGFPIGPFALFDLTGNDLGWDKETSTGDTIKDRLCEMGRFGLKSGAGYYKYEKGSRTPIHDPLVDQLILDFARERKIERRPVGDEEITKRCVYSIINEGAKILEEGVAIRPGDLDVIWVNGYGWPKSKGGPMRHADMIGLDNILKTLTEFHEKFGEVWKPAGLLKKLSAENKGFGDI